MSKFSLLSSLCVAGLLVMPACIINADDDDDGGTSDPTGTTDDPTTGSPTTDPTTEPSDTTNATEPGDTTNATDPGTTTVADTGTGSGTETEGATTGGGACGWGQTGQQKVPEGYICGGDGEDPNGTFPIDCPRDVTLVEGGECGTIEGPGCCDANGDVWFCADDGTGPVLYTQAC